MIRGTVRYGGNDVDIEFPCSDSHLRSKLLELQVEEADQTTQFLSDLIEPKELSCLKDRLINLDELNYLAKRMESFFEDEKTRFFEAMKLEHFTELKDLINLTFNVDKYTLIRDVSDLWKIGRMYLLDREGAIPAHEEDAPNYAAVGLELLQSGDGIFTEHGLLFPHRDRPFEELYQRQNFPEYWYDACLLVGAITYQDKTEYVYLPDDELAISKALKRLGAKKPENCQIALTDFSADDSQIFCTFRAVLDTEGIYEANRLAKAVDQFAGTESLRKLSAVIERVDVGDAKSIAALAENLDIFGFAPNVQDYEELGRWWLNNREKLEITPELEDHFNYAAYGEAIHAECGGGFLPDGGYVYLADGYCLEEILDGNEEEGMTMEGM